jgi:sec-independent protein translocase protein TatC
VSETEHATEEMSFTEHLSELRDRLMRVAGALLLGFMIAFAYRDPIFQFLSAPMHEALAAYGVYTFRAIEITETIFVYLKMSIVAGFILTLPVTFYQLWSFIAPGLLEKEKQAVMPLLFFSTFFFLLGAYFAFEVIIPFIARYLAELTLAADTVQMDVTVASAFGFSLKLILAFGIAFELPLVMFFLSVLGLVEPQKYIKFYRYFVLISFIVGAMLTPPDPISQLLMAVPLNLLYWVGVGASVFTRRKTKDKPVRIGSRVWLFLSLALFSIGGVLAASTWYLGRSDSALRHVPNDALWVISTRPATTLGENPSKAQYALLRDVLQLDDSLPTYRQLVIAKGPKGERLIVLAGACEQTPPDIGECSGKDLIIGGEEWLDTPRNDQQTLEDMESIKELSLSSPTFAWTRRPSSDLVSLLPGHHSLATELTRASLKLDLRTDNTSNQGPTLTLRLEPTDPSVLTAMQNRADLWRSEQIRQAEQDTRDKNAMAVNRQLLSLVEELLALEEEKFSLLKASLDNPEAWTHINARAKKLKAALKTATVAAKPPVHEAETGESLVEALKDNVNSWSVLVDKDALTFTIELEGSNMLNRLLEVFKSPPKDN